MVKMRYLTLFFAKTYYVGKLLTTKTVYVLLSVLGAMWLVTEVASLLINSVHEFLKGNFVMFVVFLALGGICTLIIQRPEVEIEERIKDSDTFIKIKVGDILEMKESCVISTNTTFDTDMTNGLISENSLQGQFTNKYYHDSIHLDSDINKALASISDFEDLSGQVPRKGKCKKYPLGTVAKVTPGDRRFYLLAIAHMNPQGNAESTFHMISDALNGLWQFLGDAGDYEKELVIPVIGKGPARVAEPREEIIQEIINSFIAASTQKQVCETLSIVIHANDFYKFDLRMEDIKHYLSAQCRYSRIRKIPGGGVAEMAS